MTRLGETSTIRSRSCQVNSFHESRSRGNTNSETGKQAAKKANKEQSKSEGNNTQTPGYDTRKTHSAKNDHTGDATSAK